MGEYFNEESGLYLPNKIKEAAIKADTFKYRDLVSLVESMSELELQLEDQSWTRLNNTGDKKEFSKKARSELMKEAYLFWVKNPLISNAVETKTNYVYGKGFSYKAESEKVQEVIDYFMNDEDNKRELTALQAQEKKDKELQIYSNLYLVFFVNDINGLVKVRSLPASEVTDIITDPEDSQKSLWYKRERVKKSYDFSKDNYDTKKEIKYYADWKQPDDLKTNMKPTKNKIANGKCYHIKVNCLTHNKFGISEIYRAMDWAKAYNKFLEDLASVWATLSKFPVKNKSKGGAGAIAAQKKKIQSALSNLGAGTESNPPPAAGSMWFENMASNMEPVNVQGASLNADDGRRLLLMVCAATGMIEPFFGDLTTANLATTKAMMGPMLRKFGSRQELWKSLWKNIFSFVIDQSIMAPKGLLDGKEVEDAYGNIRYELNKDESKQVEIDFPPLEEKESVEMIEAVGKIADKFLLPEKELTRVLMNLLEIDKADEILEEMYPEGEETPSVNIPSGDGQSEGEIGTQEGSLMETVRNLKERLEQMEE